jgi:hypothetical protein
MPPVFTMPNELHGVRSLGQTDLSLGLFLLFGGSLVILQIRCLGAIKILQSTLQAL